MIDAPQEVLQFSLGLISSLGVQRNKLLSLDQAQKQNIRHLQMLRQRLSGFSLC